MRPIKDDDSRPSSKHRNKAGRHGAGAPSLCCTARTPPQQKWCEPVPSRASTDLSVAPPRAGPPLELSRSRARERGLRDRRKNPVGSPTDALGAPSAPTSGQRRQRSAGRARPFSAPRSLLRARVSRSADRPRRRRRGLPRPRFLGFSSSARSALRRRRRAPAPRLPPRTTIPDGRPRSHRRPRTLRPGD